MRTPPSKTDPKPTNTSTVDLLLLLQAIQYEIHDQNSPTTIAISDFLRGNPQDKGAYKISALHNFGYYAMIGFAITKLRKYKNQKDKSAMRLSGLLETKYNAMNPGQLFNYAEPEKKATGIPAPVPSPLPPNPKIIPTDMANLTWTTNRKTIFFVSNRANGDDKKYATVIGSALEMMNPMIRPVFNPDPSFKTDLRLLIVHSKDKVNQDVLTRIQAHTGKNYFFFYQLLLDHFGYIILRYPADGIIELEKDKDTVAIFLMAHFTFGVHNSIIYDNSRDGYTDGWKNNQNFKALLDWIVPRYQVKFLTYNSHI